MMKELLMLNMMIISILLIILFMLTIKLFNPIMIMINILAYSLMICIKISLWKSNFMYSIILFLIMISGLLIIFLYFSSLIANEKMNFKLNKLLFLNMILNLIIFYMLNSIYDFNLFKTKKFNFSEINLIYNINEMNYQNLLNLYEYPFNNMTIMSMLYLLISLFSIVKICSIKYLTLRKIS
uniref:NADH dehydrogenase subunit 6 n=1 Tax=Acropyga panamensis TaxID=602222 RepID=A0A6G5NIH5_9HYME|nr:NADH dehydrogenase subunit 6 [Acropyga panamensis]QBG38670.1 NADH dehydrogenase subunit 6 [Acropyga panamensis]